MRKNIKGFTLIEILSVIIIMGILVLIALPAVSRYVEDSRFEAYADTVKRVIDGAITKINDGDIKMHESSVTYYIPASCIQTENSLKSPFGEFTDAYVVVNYKGLKKGYDYYWVSRDTKGVGFKDPTKLEDIKEENIDEGIKKNSISTNIAVDGRTDVYVFNEDCSSGIKKTGCVKEGKNFDFTGTVQTYKLSCTGKYKLQVWGAEGGRGRNGNTGNSLAGTAGKGGYSEGIIDVTEEIKLYIYVGGKGGDAKDGAGGAAGYNGGGAGAANSGSRTGGGGGASDIRINTDSLYSRVIVAGGGGSTGWYESLSAGNGGGSYGTSGSTYGTCSYSGGYGGSSSGGSGSVRGTFGQGASSPNTDYNPGGAGGGGWYGGGAASSATSGNNCAGGGGSGYVYTSSTYSYCPSGCLLNSSYYLKQAETVSGGSIFESPTGEDERGHSGNGYVKITYIG